MICNAYESGYGHGYDDRKMNNPHEGGTIQWKAWNYGYISGNKKQIAKHRNKVWQDSLDSIA